MHFSRARSILACSTVAAALVGCGGGGDAKVKVPDVVPAAGTVTYNEKPLEGASVLFMSAETKKNSWACAGQTDAAGKFEITSTFSPSTQVKGLPAGEYTVVVTKMEKTKTMTPAEIDAMKKEMDEKAMQAAKSGGNPVTVQPKTPSMIPEKYGADTTSDLKVKIEKPGNPKIELKLAD